MLRKFLAQASLVAALAVAPWSALQASSPLISLGQDLVALQNLSLQPVAFELVPGTFALPDGESFDQVIPLDGSDGIAAIEVHGSEPYLSDQTFFAMALQFSYPLNSLIAQQEAAGAIYGSLPSMFDTADLGEPVAHKVQGFPAFDVQFTITSCEECLGECGEEVTDSVGCQGGDCGCEGCTQGSVMLRLVVTNQAAYMFVVMAPAEDDLSADFRAFTRSFNLSR